MKLKKSNIKNSANCDAEIRKTSKRDICGKFILFRKDIMGTKNKNKDINNDDFKFVNININYFYTI